jgi:hypothetical protein
VADPNRALFESVVHLLAPLLDELVFVGGCMTGLFITDPAAGGIRPTGDVDAMSTEPPMPSTRRWRSDFGTWASVKAPPLGLRCAAGGKDT